MKVSQHFWIAIAVVLLFCSGCMHQSQYEVIEPPELTSVNIIDRNGITETITNPERLDILSNVDFLSAQPYQKVMRIFERDACGEVHSYITSYYPNGQVKQYLEVVNGRANGGYTEWHSNGAMKLQGTIIGGMADIVTGAEATWLFDGVCTVWDEQCRLVAIFNYCRGEQEGPSTYYHPNGAISKESIF